MNKKKTRGLSVLIVFAMMISIFAPMVTAYGAEGLVKHGQYNLPGASSIVGDFTIDGEQAFCIQHTMFSAPDGAAFTSELYNDPDFQKALYYGWSGPGQWSGFGSKEDGVIATSLVLSELYNPAEAGNYDYIPIVAEYKAFLATQPVPANQMVTFSQTAAAAYYDSATGGQRTPTITVNGEAGGKVTFTVPSGVSVKNVTAGTTLSGTVTLPVGTQFYLFANLGAASGTYSTGTVGEQFAFQSMIYNFGSSYQQMGKYKVIKDPAGSTQLDVKWLDVGNLHLIKTQDEGDLLDGATFILKSTSYSGFEKEYVVAGGELTIENIPVGTYLLTETVAPDGYSVVNPAYEVVIEKDKTTRRIVVNRLNPKGEINITKTDVDSGAAIEGAEFTAYAADDIYSALTLLKIYSKGDVVGTMTTDAAGVATLGSLPMGKYEVKETKVVDGYIPNDTVYPVEFRQTDFVTKIYTENLDVTNKMTTTEISKTDAVTGKELPGAKMQIKDKETGEVVKEWISGETPEIIRGLTYGKEYVLHEDLAPLGYYMAQDVTFTVGVETKVEMKDEPSKTQISKQDATTGKELPGAKMQIKDKETGEVVREWTSSDKPEMFYSLEIGRTYTLHEDLAPLGYFTAQDMDFTVSENPEETVKLIMKDEPSKVQVSKQDFTTGRELPGATLQIIDPVTGKVVEEWISKPTPHMIHGLEIGKEYVLKETMAPEGYELAEEIKFTVWDKPEVQKVVMKDEMKVGRIIVTNSGGFGPTGIVSTGDPLSNNLAWILLITTMLAMAGTAMMARRKEEK